MTDEELIAYLAGEVTNTEPVAGTSEWGDVAELRRLLADPAVWAEPDPSLEERIVGGIAAADGKRRSTSDDHQPAGASQPARRRRTRRIVYTIVGVAAAAAVGAGIVVVDTADHPREHPSGVEYAVALHGTRLAPAARGAATLTQTRSGWRILLRASGLPRRAGGSFYEAWLKNSAGVLVSIGTFNDAESVTLWAGVPPSRFPVLTVTRQRADGAQTSSGQVAAVGIAHRVQ